jgi:hypothetical protein
MGLRIKGAHLVSAAMSSVARDAALNSTPTALLLQVSQACVWCAIHHV